MLDKNHENIDIYNATKIYSFDIFDTCLTRTYARPADLFYDLALIFLEKYSIYGYDNNSIKLFVYSRKLAERQIKKINKNTREDITLLDIYNHLHTLLPWRFDVVEAMNFEMQLDQKSLKPILPIQTLIINLRNQNNQIIFISDMYLPTHFIRQCLIDNNIANSNDHIYVSGDIGLTKHSGNLYKHVLETENITPEKLHHCGDNYHADIRMANKHGIKTDYFTQAHLSYYERNIFKTTNAHQILLNSKMSAASRLSRLNQLIPNQKQSILQDLASTIIAPFLTSFVAWVLADAKAKGIERLYFVSRDGQIMYKIAQKLIDNKHDMPECRYLYGSRHAWFTPSIDKPDWKDMAWLIHGQSNRVSDLLDRLCISAEELDIHLSRHGLKSKMSYQVEGELLDSFKQFVLDPVVFEIIHSRAKSLRKNVIGYFKQEGLFDENKWAIVDLGWMLNCQGALSRILMLNGRESQAEGYYLGIRRNSTLKAEAGSCYGWIVQDKKDTYVEDKCHWLFRSNISAIIEHIFTPAYHSSVLGYNKTNNNYVAYFIDNKSIDDDNLVDTIHSTVLNYLNYIPVQLIENNLKAYTKIAVSNTEHFFTKPLIAHVEGISNFFINREQSHVEKYNRQLASRMTIQELFKLLKQSKQYNHPKHVWLEGSAALSSPIIRILLNTILFARNTLLIYKGR